MNQLTSSKYVWSNCLSDKENFINQLIHNIRISLDGMLVEKMLYNIIYLFLYNPTLILYKDIPFKRNIELPICGTNYMIVMHVENKKYSQINSNKFTLASDSDIVFEILGDYQSIDYENYYPPIKRICGDPITIYSRKIKAILYGTNPYIRTINMNHTSIRLSNIIPDVDRFYCDKYIFEYGKNITPLDYDMRLVEYKISNPTASVVMHSSLHYY